MDPSSSEASDQRFEAYIAALVAVLAHADRATPLHDYCRGLLLPGERKSVEPMAALTAPARTAAKHQSLLHFVANAAWSDAAVLAKVRELVLPSIEQQGAIVASMVDDTTFPKKGNHSVGVARQWCGQLGKQDNCQSLVTLSLANFHASLPIAHRLFLPRAWIDDMARRTKAKIPADAVFQTKPQIALDQLRQAHAAGVALGTVLADSGFGNDRQFRQGITELGQPYAVAITANLLVWQADAILPAQDAKGRRMSREKQRKMQIQARDLAKSLPAEAFQDVVWNENGEPIRSRFARQRVRVVTEDAQPSEEWLLIEWPADEAEPAKYWLSTLPADLSLKHLVEQAKLRWRIERDYQELKQEVGLGHYEGRGWRGLHHHITLCIAAYGFLIAERAAFPPCRPRRHRLDPSTALPTGARSAKPASSPRTPYATLDRDSTPPSRRRPGPAVATLPVLQSKEIQTRQAALVTQ